MFTVTLIIEAFIILALEKVGLINNSYAIYVTLAVITIISGYVLKKRLNCPFAKICPFKFCPLNKEHI